MTTTAHPAGRRAARAALLGVLALAATACATGGGGAGPRKQTIVPEGQNAPALYSPAVRTGDLIFFSGIIGTQGGAAGNVEAEMRQIFQNLERVMRAANVTKADVVKCTVYLADIRDYNAMNGVYREFFNESPPARTAIGVSGLPAGARAELECFAAAR